MLNLNGHTEDYFIYNYEQRNQLKMSKIQYFMDKINFFFLLCQSIHGQVLPHGYI